MSTPLGIDAIEVANCHIQDFDKKKGTPESIQAIQTAHRLRIIEEWLQAKQSKDIQSYSVSDLDLSLLQGNILDVGCGQGDQTGAIGAFLAKYCPSSHVYGLDPGPADYGAPYTLVQAQKHICDSKLGNFVSFEKPGKAKEGLSRYPQAHFTTLTFSHCLWYFDDEHAILDTFSSALQHGVKNILIAEWALNSSQETASFAMPHILAALLQAHAPLSNINIKLLLSPDQIVQAAEKSGWKMVRQSTFSPDAKLHDGRWEVDIAINAAEEWLNKVRSESVGQGTDPKEIVSIQSHLHALRQSLPAYSSHIRCMDVWTCHLVPNHR
ncbi:uncharacterized protein FA14DRAFT_160752 [Meira miltonrushii]|uniref:Methyltransferase domain-containing protein n=1 Tax=Meira miltonrushii TaxID=1280837 RepID=A0A316VI92_9BASI|nr:uncharacterized protein FA14DRAFT_160752 [Meira miltonrushii]PWN35721.1 hypothetical protein FA14DRAFT_160752 [Meira miltonrushii]